MDDTTRQIIVDLRASVEDISATLERLAEKLALALAKDDAGASRRLLAPVKGVSIGFRDQADRGKLATLFQLDTLPPAAKERFWADPSNSIAVRPDGSFMIQFDKARMGEGGKNTGGSSWVNAWIPLPRPVSAARISYTLTVDPQGRGIPADFWGESMKLPGLGRWVADQAPGGGEVTANNWNVRPCVSDWNKDGAEIRFGPYVYGQETRHKLKPEEVWAADYPAGTLRWWTAPAKELKPVSGMKVRVELEVTKATASPAWYVTTSLQVGDGSVAYANDMKLLPAGVGVGTEITGVPFVFMYGGDAPKYGPSVPITELLVQDFEVVEL